MAIDAKYGFLVNFMPKIFHVGVKGVIRVADKCLALKKKGVSDIFWDLPGGRINDIEEVEQALRRELKEELPTLGEYRIGAQIGLYRFQRDFFPDELPGVGLFVVFYHVEAEPFEVVLSPEHQEFKWVSLNDVAELKTDNEAIIGQGYYDALVASLKQ